MNHLQSKIQSKIQPSAPRPPHQKLNLQPPQHLIRDMGASSSSNSNDQSSSSTPSPASSPASVTSTISYPPRNVPESQPEIVSSSAQLSDDIDSATAPTNPSNSPCAVGASSVSSSPSPSSSQPTPSGGGSPNAEASSSADMVRSSPRSSPQSDFCYSDGEVSLSSVDEGAGGALELSR